jgi:phosphoribosylformylglycinamidine synthase
MEYLPGQFDQRADSAAQCVQILASGQRPPVASAKVIVLRGTLSAGDLARIKEFVINHVDSREASLAVPASLHHQSPPPPDVAILTGFLNHNSDGLARLRGELGLAMSHDDLLFCQRYFRDEEKREPSLTEIRVLDTYWSDHCRHTTFLTRIDDVTFADGTGPVRTAWETYLRTRENVYGPDSTRPVTLMDIALMGMKELRKSGELDNLEVSDEVNAASIIVPVEISNPESGISDPVSEEWLVMFKNETHNHPTEIEPFGGAATCLGGAIRDPLSGRSYVYQAMRVTGASDPRTPFSETLPGKLPQRKICQIAAHGYSSYGNQIGLATGQVSEIYHPGYVAKRMEIGAVIAAVPRSQVFRGQPSPGDVILLIGGRTGRDGVGGATGSSKEHTDTALENSAEVQKGNPPTERKIQRLFRNPELARKIKVCNDFGAGGVAVAIGEIAPSLEIDLDRVPKKYDGLDGTELAISESQERMAVLVDPADADYFQQQSDLENLECVQVAVVAGHGRLMMRWRGQTIVNLSRAFLDTNGVQLRANVHVSAQDNTSSPLARPLPDVAAIPSLTGKFRAVLSDLNQCSQKGLGERFDSSIGAGTVLSPFGGEYQLTPPDAMAAKLPLLTGHTDACTYMAWGFNPRISSWSPFYGAVYAVTESVCRVISAGGRLADIRLTLQEYFEKLGQDPARWGKPFAALLGAFHAQHALRLAAIGGKDSMSGSFNDLDVPPTLVSFAVAPGSAPLARSPEFKQPDNIISLVSVPRDADQLPDFTKLREIAGALAACHDSILSSHSLGEGGIAAGLAKMAFGNRIGAAIDTNENLFRERYASFLIESSRPLPDSLSATVLGKTISSPELRIAGESVSLDLLLEAWTSPLEGIYPTRADSPHPEIDVFSSPLPQLPRRTSATPRPRVVIPVFPGSNCEYDTARAFRDAGADPSILVFRNLTSAHVEESLISLAEAIRSSEILMLPGGFSAGDEPDGSGKFIATVLRNPRVSDAVMDLIKHRDGLILGICNGFQALVKTGLVPYGEVREPQPGAPTLTFNDIGRHVSCYVTTRVSSTLSPWLSACQVGDLHRIPVSHGEGKFYASAGDIRAFAAAGQIATQYSTTAGIPAMDIDTNPNGSLFAIEGISSPCGRVLGKMAHSERRGTNIAKNIPGPKFQPLFAGGVRYFA